MAADERYRKLLGIEPAGETPTHYELFVIDRSVTDHTVIEESYKLQMKKLQSIKTSKDKGFIEFLKEELRSARLTLTNPERRRVYDESLAADAIAGFKAFAQPFMSMGILPRAVFDTLVSKGIGDGLTKEHATQLLEAEARARGVTLQPDQPVPTAVTTRPPQLGDPEDDPSATHADTGDFEDDGPYVDVDEEPAYADEVTGSHQDEEGYADGGDDPTFSDEAEVAPAAPTRPSRGGAPPPNRPPPAPAAPKIQRGRFYDFSDSYQPQTEEPAKPVSPWARRGSTPGGRPKSAWGRTSESAGAPAPAARSDAGQRGARPAGPAGADGLRAVVDARRMFNAGAKLARIAGDLHEQLALYFPPTNGRTSLVYQINGVSFEKVFDSEQKTYRDALKKFEEALQKVDGAGIPAGEEMRQRASQNASLIKGYLEEIRQHKLKRLAPLSKPEELRMWQMFVSSKRSSRLTQTLDDR